MWSIVALGIDVFHFVFAFGSMAYLIMGSKKSLLYNILSSLWALVLFIQILCLNCPLTVLSRWLRSLDDPNITTYEWGFIHWIVHDWLKLPVTVEMVTVISLCVAVVVMAIIIGRKLG